MYLEGCLLNYSRYRLRAALRICLLLTLSVALSVSCQRQPQAEKAPEPTPQAAVKTKNPLEMPSVVVGKPYPGIGVITIINLKEGWVEINHEEIEDLMPAMQMEWSVKDRALLRNVQVGDRVEFVVVETGKGEIITELKRVKTPE
jgi:Cu/Ag efflux protein CusF